MVGTLVEKKVDPYYGAGGAEQSVFRTKSSSITIKSRRTSCDSESDLPSLESTVCM